MSRDPTRPADDPAAGPATTDGPQPETPGGDSSAARRPAPEDEERQRILDARERLLDARIDDLERRLSAQEHAAAERARAAAARDQIADQRELLADLREVAALERLLISDTGRSPDDRRLDRWHSPGPRPEPGE